MDFVSGLILICFFLVIAYFYSHNKILQTEKNIKTIQKETKLLQRESQDLLRKANVMNRVNEFLKNAFFLEKIGFWQENIIYRYIFNQGYLYEFFEILSKQQDKIGIDEDDLCFHQMCYKRVVNTSDFMKKFESEILNKKV